MSEIDQQFIEYVVKSLVGNPDAVHIERRIDEKGVLLELTVDPEDLGRVIGKRGATAQSLRTLLRALGTKNDARYNLKIVDNGEGQGQSQATGDDNATKPADTDDTSASKPESNAAEDDTSEDEAPVEQEEPAAEAEESVDAEESESEPEAAEEDPESKRPTSAPEPGSRLAQTRQELADLDDLDV